MSDDSPEITTAKIAYRHYGKLTTSEKEAVLLTLMTHAPHEIAISAQEKLNCLRRSESAQLKLTALLEGIGSKP